MSIVGMADEAGAALKALLGGVTASAKAVGITSAVSTEGALRAATKGADIIKSAAAPISSARGSLGPIGKISKADKAMRRIKGAAKLAPLKGAKSYPKPRGPTKPFHFADRKRLPADNRLVGPIRFPNARAKPVPVTTPTARAKAGGSMWGSIKNLAVKSGVGMFNGLTGVNAVRGMEATGAGLFRAAQAPFALALAPLTATAGAVLPAVGHIGIGGLRGAASGLAAMSRSIAANPTGYAKYGAVAGGVGMGAYGAFSVGRWGARRTNERHNDMANTMGLTQSLDAAYG